MKTIQYNNHELQLKVVSYASDKTNMAIQCIDQDGESYAVPTVNLGPNIGNDTIMPKYCAFMDTNNAPGLVAEFEKQGIITPYERFGSQVTMDSGYCEYPLYRFDSDKLKEFDQEGVSEYSKGYNIAFQKLQEKMNENMYASAFSGVEDYRPDSEVGLPEFK